MRVAMLFLGIVLFLFAPESWAQTTPTRQAPVDSLIYDLKNPDPVRRKEAATLIGANKVQRAVPDLVSAAGDSDPAVRREIVLALDKLLDVRAIPAFVKLMSDPERDIREKCIHGVINLYLPQESGLSVTLMKVANFFNPWSDEWSDTAVEPGVVVDRTVIDALRGRLEDSDDGIRVKAARALGILKGREAVPVMLETLRRDRSNPVRFEIIRSLRKIGDRSVAKDLMNYLAYGESRVRNEAVFTLGRFRHVDAVSELTSLYEKEAKLPAKKMDRAYREFLLDALAFIAAPVSKDLFVKERMNPHDNLRLHAVEGLARIGAPELVTEISRDRLAEKDPRIRTAQAFALYRMGRKEYLDELVDSLAKRRSHSEAKQYIVELKADELPDLYAQAKKNDVDIRESLAEIFGLIGDSAAIPVLQELNKDRRGQISALANQALRRIHARTAPQ